MVRASVLIVCDDTFLDNNDNHSDTRDNVLLDTGSCLELLGQPRVLVLFPTLQRDIPAGSNVPHLRDILDATLLVPSGSDSNMNSSSLQTRPAELVITYHRQEIIQETLLCQKLRECDPESAYLGQYFRDANLVLRELGPCAADLVWREAFGPTSIDKQTFVVNDVDDQSPFVSASDLIKHWPFKLPNLDMTSRNVNVSHKFIRLVQVLETFETYGDNFRGIVFGTSIQ
jgi:endoribonuclease Dicer